MPEATSPTGVAAPDDETLVRLARQGSRSACEELFQRHRGVAFAVAFRLLGNEQDALDAVQDGLLKAFLGLKDFDGRSGFRTWLLRIVHNAALDQGRKRSRRAVFGIGSGTALGRHHEGNGQTHRPAPEPSTWDDPAHDLHRADLRRVLNLVLARLSPKVQTTFVLFAEAGLSYKEIAEIQEIPIGTVMSRLNAARQKLQSSPEIQNLDGF
jgi:RNA polymerase sigma-70 factor (ECF subfamily)